MSNPAISREEVHTLAEACADSADTFQNTARRLLKQQKSLTNFMQKNMVHLAPETREVVLYMYAVSLRIFEQKGGLLKKVSGKEISATSTKVNAALESLMPFDKDFPSRLRGMDWRAQEHLLDECLWALFEKEEKEEGEVDVDPNQAGLMFLLLWVAVETLDSNWSSPNA
jgi:hypothetical protein